MPPESTGLMPPYWAITPLVQYRVPAKYTHAGRQAEAQARRRPPPQRRHERERHEERGKGDPGDGWVSEAGETEREQQA